MNTEKKINTIENKYLFPETEKGPAIKIEETQKNFEEKIKKILNTLGSKGLDLYEKLDKENHLSKEALAKIRREFPEQFRSVLEVIQERKKIIKNLEKYIETSSLHEESDPRSAIQLRTLQKTVEFLKRGGSKGIIWHPTGTGKSRIISLLANESDAKTMIQSPSLIVNEQMIQLFQKNELDEYEWDRNDIAIYDSAHEKDKQPENPRLLITTYNSAEDHLRKFQPQMIFSDETHRDFSDERIQRIQNFESEKRKYFSQKSQFDEDINNILAQAIKISFSATPFIGKKDFKELGYELIDMATLKECIECGLLAPVRVNIKELKLKNNIYREGEAGFQLEGDDDIILNQQYLDNYDEIRNILRREKNDQNLNPQGIDFCYSRKQARDMANLRNTKELSITEDVTTITTVEKLDQFQKKYGLFPFAFFLDGDSNDSLRNRIQELYRQKKIHILTGARIFNEGLDLPMAEIANINPMASWTDYIQRLGRVLRIDKNNSLKKAYIFDHIVLKKDCCTADHAIDMNYIPKAIQRKIMDGYESVSETLKKHYEKLHTTQKTYRLDPFQFQGAHIEHPHQIFQEKVLKLSDIAHQIEQKEWDKNQFSGFDGHKFSIRFSIPRKKNAVQIVEFPTFEGVMDNLKILKRYPKQFFQSIKKKNSNHTLWDILNTLAKRQGQEPFSVKLLQEENQYETDRLRCYLKSFDNLYAMQQAA